MIFSRKNKTFTKKIAVTDHASNEAEFSATFEATNSFRWWVPLGGLNQSPIHRVLQQAYQGSDGSVEWVDVPMEFEEAHGLGYKADQDAT